jgi:peptidoglycan/xylan/chitin deacetylase (PgdA/CDA1 family)
MIEVAHAAVDALYRTGSNHGVSSRYGGLGSIFAFHSVVSQRSSYLNTPIRTSLRFMEAWIHSLRRRKIAVISLDEAIARLGNQQAGRFVVVTFDDGYADNFTHVLPLFEKHGLPFTVYVTSDLIERRLYCWWVGLERLFLKNDEVEIAPMGKRWKLPTLSAKVRARCEAFEWVHGDITARAPLLKDAFRRYDVSTEAIADEEGMTPGQLRGLAYSSLATIGAHTVSHPELAKLSAEDCRTEMFVSKRALETIIDKPVTHFSYPFGNKAACGQREAELAREVGFKSAVTSRNGCLFPQHQHNLHLLPRLPPNANRGRLEWLGLMHVQQAGLGRLIQSRGGEPAITL